MRRQSRRTRRVIEIVLIVLAMSPAVVAQDAAPPVAATPDRADLTVANFFSTGWNEPWTRRSRGNGTPNMSLLRVQTNFLVQLVRTDYALQRNRGDASDRSSDGVTGTVEYAFNRRLMLGTVGNYRRTDSRTAQNLEGAAGAVFARLQWLDTASNSVASTFRVALPNYNFGERDTTYSLSVAGWRDLAPLGLNRVGFYYHLQADSLAGPHAAGSRQNDLTYALSLAKSWTSPARRLGNVTTFVEGYGRTDLDGRGRGGALLTATPGIRATLARRHIVIAGIELPLTEPKPFARIVRLTYIYNF